MAICCILASNRCKSTVLDLSRLIIAHAPESYAEPEFTTRFFNALFEGAEWSQPWTPLPLPKFRETNILLLFRALANAFKDDSTIGDGAWIKLVCFAILVWSCGLRADGFALTNATLFLQIFEKIQQAPYAAFTKPQTRMTLSTIYFKCAYDHCLLCHSSDPILCSMSCRGVREQLDPGLRSALLALVLSVWHFESWTCRYHRSLEICRYSKMRPKMRRRLTALLLHLGTS